MGISRSAVFVTAACFAALGLGLYSHRANVTALPKVQSAVTTPTGELLTSFFEGLPVSPAVKKYAEINEARLKHHGRPGFVSKLGHFFGFGAIVYAQSCGGCNEHQAPPGADCDGCGTRDYTIYGDWTGMGFYTGGYCGSCGTSQNAYTCEGQGC